MCHVFFLTNLNTLLTTNKHCLGFGRNHSRRTGYCAKSPGACPGPVPAEGRTFLRTLGNSKPRVYVFFDGFFPVLAMAFIFLKVKSFGHSQRAKCKRNESMCQFVYAKALNLPFPCAFEMFCWFVCEAFIEPFI